MEKWYRCPVPNCNRKFKTLLNLSIHLKRDHNVLSECPICKKRFRGIHFHYLHMSKKCELHAIIRFLIYRRSYNRNSKEYFEGEKLAERLLVVYEIDDVLKYPILIRRHVEETNKKITVWFTFGSAYLKSHIYKLISECYDLDYKLVTKKVTELFNKYRGDFEIYANRIYMTIFKFDVVKPEIYEDNAKRNVERITQLFEQMVTELFKWCQAQAIKNTRVQYDNCDSIYNFEEFKFEMLDRNNGDPK